MVSIPSLSQHPFDSFLSPKSVAVFGASTNPQKSGYKIIENLLNHHYSGRIYPINPRGGEILGFPVFRTITEILEPIDLAILFIPNSATIEVLQACIQKGVKAAIIEAAGFGEVEMGKPLVQEIRRITANFSKIRILGPNCTGITVVEKDGAGLFTSFIPMGSTKAGNIAIVSQSGFINGAYYPDFTERNPSMGIRYVIAIGNKMDLNELNILEYLVLDPTVTIIGLYLESFTDIRYFIDLCHRARTAGKSIILLRGGFSEVGSRATHSHTGALLERAELVHAVVQQSGCILADDFWEFFLLLRTMSHLQGFVFPQSPLTAAILTISGASGAVCADWCHHYNIQIPSWDPTSYAALKALNPPWMDPNPFCIVDYWPAVEEAKGDYHSLLMRIITLALQNPAIHGVFLTAYYNSKAWQVDWAQIAALMRQYQKPLFIWIFGTYTDLLFADRLFHDLRLPLFYSERELVQIFHKIYQNTGKSHPPVNNRNDSE